MQIYKFKRFVIFIILEIYEYRHFAKCIEKKEIIKLVKLWNVEYFINLRIEEKKVMMKDIYYTDFKCVYCVYCVYLMFFYVIYTLYRFIMIDRFLHIQPVQPVYKYNQYK